VSFRPPQTFAQDLEALEDVERATLRFVAQGVSDILEIAADQFSGIVVGGHVGDKANYLGEDLTRLALDRIGAPSVPDGRLFGATDYKLASYQFLPDFAVRQALFVDSKAEAGALNNARIQVTQTSLEIRQVVGGGPMVVPGGMPAVWETDGVDFLTTTIFVKYHYRAQEGLLSLRQISVVGLPNGFLQARYNPTPDDRIWNVGPNAPLLGERFRTRVNFNLLQEKAAWRVQRLIPGVDWEFSG
jgi:hypothetical protein